MMKMPNTSREKGLGRAGEHDEEVDISMQAYM